MLHGDAGRGRCAGEGDCAARAVALGVERERAAASTVVPSRHRDLSVGAGLVVRPAGIDRAACFKGNCGLVFFRVVGCSIVQVYGA